MKKALALAVLALVVVGAGYLTLHPKSAGTREEGGAGENVEEEREIPIYPGSVPENLPSFLPAQFPFGGLENLSSFWVEKDAGQVLEWYREALENRGYTLVGMQGLMTIGSPTGPLDLGWFIFARENKGVGVGAAGNENGSFYLLARGEPSSLAPGWELLPSSDQAKGWEPIPRYPGSVMLSRSVSGNQVQVTYGTPERNVTTIAYWFRQALTGRGWAVEEENLFSAFLLLGRGENQVRIDVLPGAFYSTIEVSHRSG
jgi:hypothetical protein